MKYEEVEKVLENCKHIVYKPYTGTDFCRDFYFTVFGIEYRIEWYCNIMYLYINNTVQIPFYYFEESGTWPNRFKTNLQFYDNKKESGFLVKGNVVCILPIEKYP